LARFDEPPFSVASRATSALRSEALMNLSRNSVNVGAR
jgi:hypothetical protein